MDTINAGLFPISFNAHIIFTIISVLFFIFQYVRQKHVYQLLCAIAIPLPLLLYVNSSTIVFDAIGIVELVMVIAIGVMLFSTGKKEDEKSKEKQAITSKTTEKESNQNG